MDGKELKSTVEAAARWETGAVPTSSLKDLRQERETARLKSEKHGRGTACLELELQREVQLGPEHNYRKQQGKKKHPAVCKENADHIIFSSCKTSTSLLYMVNFREGNMRC